MAGLLLLTAPPAADAGSACLHPLPVGELESVLREWLTGEGFTVAESYKLRDEVSFDAVRAETRVAVTLTPNSPLGARMEVRAAPGSAAVPDLCKGFADYLAGYFNRSNVKTAPASPQGAPAVPEAVLARIHATVCIEGRESGAVSQQSGVVVDPEGLILCTTHALTGNEALRVTLHDGRTFTGRLVKFDPRRDLALIRVGGRLQEAVHPGQGRNNLEEGEIIYAVGCPQNRPGTVSPGIVDGPPRRAEAMAFWQARMEIHPGSSGSPVFDASGRMVGIVKGRFRGTNSIGFIIPLETVGEFIRQP
jgi:serine protease Do